VLPKAWGDWALINLSGWTPDMVRTEAANFADYWHAKAGKDAAKADWQATWRVWCRKARPVGLPRIPATNTTTNLDASEQFMPEAPQP
jgi:hypothetical protein